MIHLSVQSFSSLFTFRCAVLGQNMHWKKTNNQSKMEILLISLLFAIIVGTQQL